MYVFHASDPDSLPPPVSFSPPKAPPISAPLVPIFTFAIPQSLPSELRNNSASLMSLVKIELLRPCLTLFCISIASAKFLNLLTYKIGANVSLSISSSTFETSTIAGVT